MKPTPLTILFTAFVAVTLTSCSKKTIINVEKDDPEMKAAIAKARETLPEFWKVFEHPSRGESGFALKVAITDKHGTEHFWAIDPRREDGKITGTIDNDPEIVRNVKIGQRITIPEADISDWNYTRGGKMVGNYTLRVLLKQMPAKEAEEYKQMLADP